MPKADKLSLAMNLEIRLAQKLADLDTAATGGDRVAMKALTRIVPEAFALGCAWSGVFWSAVSRRRHRMIGITPHIRAAVRTTFPGINRHFTVKTVAKGSTSYAAIQAVNGKLIAAD